MFYANIDRLQRCETQEEGEAGARGVYEGNENGLAESVVISSGGHGRLPHPTLYTDNRHHSNFKKKKFITFKF